MDSFLQLVIEFASTHTWMATILIVLGGIVFFATTLKAAVLAIVAMTPTKKDDLIATKFYTALDMLSIYVQPLVDYFKKKFGL